MKGIKSKSVCICHAEKSLEDMAEFEQGLEQERLNMQAHFNTQRQGKCLTFNQRCSF